MEEEKTAAEVAAEQAAAAAAATAEQERLQQEGECGICFEDPAGKGGKVALVPCGHMLCVQCSDAHVQVGQPCFTCAVPVQSVQRLY